MELKVLLLNLIEKRRKCQNYSRDELCCKRSIWVAGCIARRDKRVRAKENALSLLLAMIITHSMALNYCGNIIFTFSLVSPFATYRKINILHITAMCSAWKEGKNSVTMWSVHKRMIMHSNFPHFPRSLYASYLHYFADATWGDVGSEQTPLNLLLFLVNISLSHIYVYVGIKRHKFNALWRKPTCEFKCFSMKFSTQTKYNWITLRVDGGSSGEVCCGTC